MWGPQDNVHFYPFTWKQAAQLPYAWVDGVGGPSTGIVGWMPSYSRKSEAWEDAPQTSPK